MNDIPQVIDLVSIELTGSEFRTEQESALRQKLKTEPFAVMVRGQQSIAAGAGLSQSLVVLVSSVIVPGLLYDLFKYVLSRTFKALSETMSSDVPLSRVTFKTRDCDYIISSNCNAGVYSELVDYNQRFLEWNHLLNAKRKTTVLLPRSKLRAIYGSKNMDGKLCAAALATTHFGKSNTKVATNGRKLCLTQPMKRL